MYYPNAQNRYFQTPDIQEERTTMLTIKVLGPNSPYTDKLEQYARAALRMLNPHCGYELLRVSEADAIAAYVSKSPALVINDVVVSEGAIPAPQLIVSWASEAMQTALEQSASLPRFAAAEALAQAAR